MQEKIIFFNSTSSDATSLVYFLVGLLALTALVSIAVYRYRRFKTYQEFTQELSLLQFDESEETALTNIVKRHSLKEPVTVLFSLKLFDELATKEISRVLGSPGSIAQKQKFVNLVYEIRKKTYFQDFVSKPDERKKPEELQTAAEMN